MNLHRVAVIGGDGIGPEVVAVALDVVRASGVTLDTVDYDLGGVRYLRTSEVLPDSVLEEIGAGEKPRLPSDTPRKPCRFRATR